MVAKAPNDRLPSMENVVAALDALKQPQINFEATNIIDMRSLDATWSPIRATVMVVEESRLQAGMGR